VQQYGDCPKCIHHVPRCNHTLFISWFLILSGRLSIDEEQFQGTWVDGWQLGNLHNNNSKGNHHNECSHNHNLYERVGHKSIRPSSLTFFITNSSEMVTNPSPNHQKVSISSTHFTIHHHHHHQHRFSLHQQKFARIVFLARPCMTDCFAHVSVHVIR
jgi:hypothetical protein